MSNLVVRMQRLSRWLDRIALDIACAGMGLMVICILIQIVARYIFSEPPAWTEELARYAMIWAGFTGATAAFQRGLDPVLVLTDAFQRTWMRNAAYWIEVLSVSAFCITVLAATPQFIALHQMRVTDTMELPSAVVFAIIPACLAVIQFHAIVRILGRLTGSPEPSTNSEEMT